LLARKEQTFENSVCKTIPLPQVVKIMIEISDKDVRIGLENIHKNY